MVLSMKCGEFFQDGDNYQKISICLFSCDKFKAYSRWEGIFQMMGKSQEQPTNICRSKPWFPFNFPLNQCSMSIVSSDLGIGCDWVGSKSLTVFHAVDGW